jgi:hypothetical protein
MQNKQEKTKEDSTKEEETKARGPSHLERIFDAVRCEIKHKRAPVLNAIDEARALHAFHNGEGPSGWRAAARILTNLKMEGEHFRRGLYLFERFPTNEQVLEIVNHKKEKPTKETKHDEKLKAIAAGIRRRKT